jgi:hypothetical protein
MPECAACGRNLRSRYTVDSEGKETSYCSKKCAYSGPEGEFVKEMDAGLSQLFGDTKQGAQARKRGRR